ncbi:uncharacterized protein LY89DRAFT_453457 [Mollisia scopiformis]|uniref:Uncharacterized protein n=1 Tax=Mollisia scopiformis TaxID=149040 RepID=A0A194XLU5_MOLSC|nr:uncharacterized protein LY89DRAFT_453457 [Mollisia scopiformis]KUJ20737.1 hypothetical protein LY89DRAFT_453457 [Mollisia scopiformis]
MMPKWFRWPQTTLLSRSGFVLSVFEILEDIKESSLQNNITIKLAVVSVLGWIRNEWGDLIDEACLLADIELYEQPHVKAEIAAKTAPKGGSVLILDHGSYHLDIVYAAWDIQEKAYKPKQSVGMTDMGTSRMIKDLTFRVLFAYNANANVTEDDRRWPIAAGLDDIAQEVALARNEIKYGIGRAESQAIIGQDTSINITEPSGRLRIVNVTSQDIVHVQEQYMAAISKSIRTALIQNDLMAEYFRPSQSSRRRTM